MKFRTAILLTLLAEALVASIGIYFYGWNIEGLSATTRFSGRLSLVIFSFIFLLHPNRKTSLRAYLSADYFLIFAIAHGIHLVELLCNVYFSGTELVPYRVAGGFLAYLLIFLMPWFKMRSDQGKLNGERLQSLGYVYLFYVWFIFFMTYISRINGAFTSEGDTHTTHFILMGWVCLMLFIKLLATIFNTSKITV